MPLLHRGLEAIRDVAASGGRVLLVGTKRQAAETIAETARKTGQYYVNHRWLGGMLTNWKTISNSIKRLKDLEDQLASGTQGLTKKELLNLTRERDKLDRALGGIKEMGALPDILFVIDTNKEQLAIREAIKLEIPVVAVLDSNSDPDGITYPVPGNDDAMRAIALYCDPGGNRGPERTAGGTDRGWPGYRRVGRRAGRGRSAGRSRPRPQRPRPQRPRPPAAPAPAASAPHPHRADRHRSHRHRADRHREPIIGGM